MIVAGYATVSPQRAYVLSQEIADWGGGNSWTNSLYFISSQPSSSDICTDLGQSPEGLFILQDVSSGKYVSLGSESRLSAAAGVDVLATKFRLAFKPGGSTLQAVSNGNFVTADSSGENILAATKESASLYEMFRWYPQPDESYHFRALSNKGWVGTEGEGFLKNNGTASNYRLLPVDDAPLPPPPATGKLRNLETNSFVTASESDPVLRVGGSEQDATVWALERVADSPDTAPLYGIRSTVTNLFVTADPSGSSPLAATNGGVGGWEQFQFLAYNGGFIILHSVTGMAVAAQPDQTLIDNNLSIDASAQWVIV